MRSHDIRRGRRDEARPARRAKANRPRRGGTPGVEALEGRLVLTNSTWLGAVSNMWLDAGNWSDNAPANGYDLIFPSGAANLANNNNLTPGTSFGSVTISGSGYAITGAPIGLNGSISATEASGSDQFGLPIALGVNATVDVAAAPVTLTLGGAITGAFGLQKSGSGTAILTAANTYTGATTAGAGTLQIDGPQSSSAVTVDAGATLQGIGTVGAIDAVGGTVSPGDGAPGTLTDTGPLTLAAASTFSAEISGTAASQLQATGPINLGGAALNVAIGTAPTGNTQFVLIHNAGSSAITGTFAGLPEGSEVTFGGQTFQISYVGGSGHDVVLTHLVSSSTALSASTTSTTFGTPVTLTATVTGGGGAGVPTGSVEFVNGSTDLGPGTLDSSGHASLTTSTLPVGPDQIQAVYAGDTSFKASSSPQETVTVAKAPTTTALTVNPTTSTFGSSVALTATVTPTTTGIGTPTGTVEFLNGTTEIETVAMVNGVATLNTTTLPAGTDSITAVYESDDNFAASTSTAVTATVTVVPTATTLTASPTNPPLGGTVELTATVAPTNGNTGTPSGTVTFFDGTNVLGTGSLSTGGVATLATTGLTGGVNVLTATFNAGGNFGTSTSNTVNISVPQGSSTTALTVSPNPSSFGQSVTLAATVTSIGGGTLLATGTVQFFDGATSLGTASVLSGIASLTTTTLPLGTSTVTAQYQGSSSFTGSTSPGVAVSVALAVPTVTVTTSIPNPGPTQTVVLTAKVASGLSGNTPTGTVEFFANGADLGSATLASGTASLTLKGTLPIGNLAIVAQYSGDASNAPGTSATLTLPVGTPLEQYINAIYINALGRSVDAGGGKILTINSGSLSAWVTKYVKNHGFRSPIVNAILRSKETRQFAVQATYTHLANKQPAHPQLANAFVDSNGTTVNLNARVLGGPAYFAAAGSTNAGFLSALGNDVLGTPLPDATTTIFTNELDHGVSRSTVARQLLTSPSGKLSQINGIYQRILNRLADLGGIKTSFAILNQGKSDERILANLLASNEYFNSFNTSTTP